MTGNLEATNGRRFGFELTIFRFSLTPEQPDSESGWRTNQVYIAHFAVTDADAERFFVAERFSRGALGLAGARAAPFRVWIDDWEIATAESGGDPEHWRLRADDDEFGLRLDLSAAKAPVLNGSDGLSQKSAERGNASYYYSITRWRSEGRIRVGSDEYRVSGLAWLDREWSSSALAADQQGWDWFALQLDHGSELMFYNLRKTDGSQDAYSAGTWIAADGNARHIDRDEISIAVTDSWQSPQGGAYPSAWEIRYPQQDLVLDVRPVMADQELFTTVRYWEGAVDVAGMRDGADVRGRGYVELTGYVN
ncbi:MAG: carotenoid 1,2-hydratase, partial [Gammaproteobacteria bacterium]|nr:carotenoid 1,2-hydratase [Gammaproteobacteria bacterium]